MSRFYVFYQPIIKIVPPLFKGTSMKLEKTAKKAIIKMYECICGEYIR